MRAQTRSKKCGKLTPSLATHSTVHEISEEAGTTITAQPRVLRRSTRRAMIKAHEGAFEGTVHEGELRPRGKQMVILCQYTYSKKMEPPVDDGDDDHDEDGNRIIVAERDPQVRSAIKSFDERVKALKGYEEKLGHCL